MVSFPLELGKQFFAVDIRLAPNPRYYIIEYVNIAQAQDNEIQNIHNNAVPYIALTSSLGTEVYHKRACHRPERQAH